MVERNGHFFNKRRTVPPLFLIMQRLFYGTEFETFFVFYCSLCCQQHGSLGIATEGPELLAVNFDEVLEIFKQRIVL